MGCIHCNDRGYRENLVATFCSDIKKYFDGHIVGDNPLICPRKIMGFQSGDGLEYCQAAHAERNAIAIAAKLGHSTNGCSMYLDWVIPCVECTKSIINAGIKEIIVLKLEDYDKKGITGRQLLEQAGIEIRTYNL